MYHSSMVTGHSSIPITFSKTAGRSPSMKYSISASAWVIPLRAEWVLNSAMYSSAVVVCLRTRSLALARPALSEAAKAVLISSTRSVYVPQSFPLRSVVIRASFQGPAVPSCMKDNKKAIFFLSLL